MNSANDKEAKAAAKREAARLRKQKSRSNITEEERMEQNASLRKKRCIENPVNLDSAAIAFNETMNFSRFETNTMESLLLYYLNSGLNEYQHLQNNDSELSEEQLFSTMNEILDHTLSCEEKETLLKRYFEVQGTASATYGSNFCGNRERQTYDCYMTTCGSCGIKNFERNGNKYTEIVIEDFSDVLQLSETDANAYSNLRTLEPLQIPINDKLETRCIDVYKLLSVYYDDRTGKSFHVHPQFVHQTLGKPSTYVCRTCFDCLKCHRVPPNSLASGLDLGDSARVGLTTPTAHEQTIIAKARLYHSIVRVESNTRIGGRTNFSSSRLKAHFVLFRHDAPEIASLASLISAFDSGNVREQQKWTNLMQIHFVGPTGEIDTLRQSYSQSSSVRLRSYVIYQWLLVLQTINPKYKNDLPLPSMEHLDAVLEQLRNSILDQAVAVTDENIIQRSNAIADDTAQTRSSILRSAPAVDPTLDMATEYSYIFSPYEQEITQKNRETAYRLLAIADALHVKIDSDRVTSTPRVWTTSRESEPLTMYGEHDLSLILAFPNVFMLGRTYRKTKGCLTITQLQHLLMQYTGVPARCRELLFFLFNEKEIEATNLSVSAAVKSGKFGNYQKLLKDDVFKSQVKFAAENQSSDCARKVFCTISDILTLTTGNKITFGTSQMARVTSNCIALTKRHGSPSTFLTIAPADCSNANIFRWTLTPSDNHSFPCTTDAEFRQHLYNNRKNCQSGTMEFNGSYSNRAKRVINNPVAAALEYQSIIENVLATLVGLPKSHVSHCISPRNNSRSSYYRQQTKGILGYVRAYYGVTETQSRGALHLHVLIYGGITPDLLQSAAEHEGLTFTIGSALDSMYQATISRAQHVVRLLESKILSLDQKSKHPKPHYSLGIPPAPNTEAWEIYTSQCISSNNFHTHSFTCKKGKVGLTKCRECFQRGLVNRTGPVLLEPSKPIHDASAPGNKSSPPTVSYPIPRRNQDTPGPSNNQALPLPDSRCICYELKRPQVETFPNIHFDFTNTETLKQAVLRCILALRSELQSIPSSYWMINWLEEQDPKVVAHVYDYINASLPNINGYIVEYNDVLSNVTGSNSCVSLLGSTVQAKGALHYIGPYMEKEKAAKTTALLAMEEAMNHVAKYPSKADDSGTAIRTIQHVVARTQNTIAMQREISDTQAAQLLLGFSVDISSETFVYYGAWQAVTFVLARMGREQREQFQSSVYGNAESDPSDDEFDPETDDLIHSYTNSKESGSSPLYVVDHDQEGNPIRKAVPYQFHYAYRGPGLAHLSRYEYAALIDVKRKGKDSRTASGSATESIKPGRKPPAKFPFHENHPLFETHHQALRSKQPTVIFMGKPPKLVSDSTEVASFTANNFACYYLAAFRPETNAFDGSCNIGLRYDYTAFASWMQQLKQGSTVLDQFRYQAVSRSIYSLHSKRSHRDLLTAYRFRDTDEWSEEEQKSIKEAREIRLLQQKNSTRTTDGDETLIDEKFFWTKHKLNIANSLASFTSAQNRALNRVYKYDCAPYTSLPTTSDQRNPHLFHLNKSNLERLNECDGFLQKYKPDPPPVVVTQDSDSDDSLFNIRYNEETGELNTIQQHLHCIETWLDGRDPDKILSGDQKQCLLHPDQGLFARIYQYQNSPPDTFDYENPPHIIITGEPGTGKSETLLAAVQISKEFNICHIATTAHYGIAAVNIASPTFCTLFNYNPTCRTSNGLPNLTEEQKHTLANRIQIQRIGAVIFDEGGVMDPVFLAVADIRLRQVLDSNHPFGGLPIGIIMDPNQLGPCGSTSLTEGLVKQHLRSQIVKIPYKERTAKQNEIMRSIVRENKPTDLFEQGCNLFRNFFRFHLRTQHRCDDASHTRIVTKMTRGVKLNMLDLAQYKPLSSDDVSNPDSKWRFAPILVNTNRERLNICHHQALLFAKDHNTHVIRWPNMYGQWISKPTDTDYSLYAMEDPAFWQYAVIGAAVFLTKNICVDLGLANGTPACIYSITPSSSEQQHQIETDVEALPFGSIISLHEPPLAINVQLTKLDGRNASFGSGVDPILVLREKASLLPKDSSDMPVVPLLVDTLAKRKDYYIPNEPGCYGHSKLCNVQNPFPFDLAFAMTIHKAQGRTLEKVILALSKQNKGSLNFSFEAIYVALSRVKCQDDVRCLVHGRQADSFATELSHITKLKADPFVRCYLDSFDERSSGRINETLINNFLQ